MLKKILSHSFWLLIGNSVGKVAMFLTNIFAARLLSQEIFGQFTMIRSTVNMGSSFISSALGLTAVKRIAEIKQDNERQLPSIILSVFLVNITALIAIVTFVLLFSQWIINTFFLGISSLVIALYIGMFILVGSTFSILTQNILIGFERFKIPAFLSLTVTIISLPIIFFLIKTYNLYGALLSVFIYFSFDFLLKSFYLKRTLSFPGYKFDFKAIIQSSNKLVSFSFPLTLSIIINTFSFWYARILVVNSSQGFSNLAIFDAAYQWLTIIMLITGATTSVALPMLSKAFGKQNQKELAKIFNLNLAVNFGIALGIASLFILLSKQIMGLYGEKYIPGNVVLIVLSSTSVFFSISSIYNKFMIAHDKVWVIFFASVLGSVVLFVVLTIFTTKQAMGLAWAFFSFYSTTLVVYVLTKLLLSHNRKMS